MSDLLNGLLAGLNQPNQPSSQPGGLNLASQSSAQAQATDFRDNTILPSISEQMRAAQAMILPMLRNSIEQQPRLDEESNVLWGRLNDSLAPKEYGFDRFVQDLVQGNKGSSPAELLANMAASTGKGKQAFDEREIAKAQVLQELAQKRADSNEKRVFDLFGKANSLRGNALPEFTLPDGTPVYKAGTRLVYVGKDGQAKEWLGAEKSVMGADVMYRSRAQLVESLAKQYLERGEYQNLETATQAAEAEANRIMSGVDKSTGVQPRPSTAAAATPSTLSSLDGRPTAPIDGSLNIDLDMLSRWSPEDQASANRVISRYQSNPNDGTKRAMESELARISAGYGVQSTPKKNVQLASEKEAYGSSTGKHMSDTSIDIQKTGQAANDIIGDLSAMEGLYKEHGENIPEGLLGGIIANIKSGAKSLGIDVKGAGATDVINALAVKQALKSRTSEGTNLLPGAMSNYEDQLLQKTVPVLGLTHEGRMVLIQIMKAQLGMKVKLAEAAREHISQFGRLDESWFNTAADIAKTNPFLDPERLSALEEYGRRLSKGVK